MNKIIFAVVCGFFLVSFSAVAQHTDTDAEQHGLQLTPELLELLRSEMREVATGMQAIPLALASAEWHAIHETAWRIKNSYVLKQSLTEAQLAELGRALPDSFKQLDSEFHQRAGSLAEAAKNRDAEAVAFHYSRMLENCTDCHSQFAQERFPGFRKQQPDHHH